MSEQVLERLDRLISLVSLAFSDEIETARADIRQSPIAEAVLDHAADWTAAGELQRAAAKAADVSTRRVRAEVAALLSRGALNVRGGGPNIEYKTTGLV